jgi:hypothetical protein
MDILEQEWETYQKHRAELLRQGRGQFVLIKGDEIAGIYANEDDALEAGYERFGVGPLLVQQILEVDEVITFTGVDVRD